MRIAILTLAIVFLGACVSQTIMPSAHTLTGSSAQEAINIAEPGKIPGTYFIDAPDASELAFHGQRDSVGVTGGQNSGMMYPAYDAASFLVAIATHAAISGSINKSKRSKAIEAADMVTKPYLVITQQLTPDSVLQETILLHSVTNPSLHQMQTAEHLPSSNSWYTRISPVFIMATSEDSIIIKNTVEIMESRYINSQQLENLAYSKTIIFQSTPLENKSAWLQSNGEIFKTTLNKLLLASIKLALNDFSHAGQNKPEYSTIRYLNNGKRKSNEAVF